MARVRVFLLTYRRAGLLRRAVRSLLAQTFTDWTCELHNDAPDDSEPADVLEELAAGDPRFTYHRHEENWGPVAAFNHTYRGGSEPYASILEDDNWWDPGFLADAIRTVEANPAAALVWSNLRLWRETTTGAWDDTGRTVWDVKPGTPPMLTFCRPELIQAVDALHSNGAMLFRPDRFEPRCVPAKTPFAIIEAVRERAARGSLILLTAPLANFAITLKTARTSDRVDWGQSQLLLADTFLRHVAISEDAVAKLWAHYRRTRPRTNLLFLLGFVGTTPRGWLRHAGAFEWAWFIANFLRHPISNVRTLRFRSARREAWLYLDQATANRYRMMNGALTSDSIVAKNDSARMTC
jgi:glycosyltransferase involved in cell wall biosynthesis